MEAKAIVFPKITSSVIEYCLLTTSFFIPFFISGPQLLTGILVNMLLFLFAMQTQSKKTFLVILLPSLGALLNGFLFGKFTVFLMYFLPFIWIGNHALISFFRLFAKKNSPLFPVVGSSLIKFLVIFSAAYLLTFTKTVPLIFLQSMGLFQLYTALIGGICAWGINTFFFKKICQMKKN